jgi:hypothetical protein
MQSTPKLYSEDQQQSGPKDRPLPSLKRRPHFSNTYMSKREKNLGRKSRPGLKPRMTVLARASSNLTDLPIQSESEPISAMKAPRASRAGLSNAAPVIYFPGALIYFTGFNLNQNFKKTIFLNNNIFQFFS